MIYEIESGELFKKDELHELVIAGFSDTDPHYSGPDAEMFYEAPQTRIIFFDGYIRAFLNDCEVTGNFYRLWFVKHIDEPPTTSTISVMSEKPRSTAQMYTPTGAVSLDPSSDYIRTVTEYKADSFRNIKSIIMQLAHYHGIFVESEFESSISFGDLLLLYSFPLLRELYQKGMSTFNLRQLCDINVNSSLEHTQSDEGWRTVVREEYDSLDFMRCKTLKETISKCLDSKSSKKITKILTEENILMRKIYHKVKVEKEVLERDPLAAIKYQKRHMEMRGFSNFNGETASKVELNIEILLLIKYLKKYLTIDHIQTVLENISKYKNILENPVTASMFKLKDDLIKSYPKVRVMKLFSEEFERHEIVDACRQWAEYQDPEKIPEKLKDKYPKGIPRPKKPSSWREIHDRISKIYNEIKSEEKNVPFEYSEKEFKLHFAEMDNIMLKLPASGSTVVLWGSEMKHCIAGSIDRHHKKECILLAVYVDGVFKYNAQFSKKRSFDEIANEYSGGTLSPTWELYQCRGLSNANPEPGVKETIEELGLSILNEAQCEGHQKSYAL